MRALGIVVLTLAVLAGASSAHAQRKGPPDGGGSGTDAMKAQADAKDREAKEKAYQDALKRIPASSEKQDPWKNAR